MMKKIILILLVAAICSISSFSQQAKIDFLQDTFLLDFNDEFVNILQKNIGVKNVSTEYEEIIYASGFISESGMECPVYVRFKMYREKLDIVTIKFGYPDNYNDFMEIYFGVCEKLNILPNLSEEKYLEIKTHDEEITQGIVINDITHMLVLHETGGQTAMTLDIHELNY